MAYWQRLVRDLHQDRNPGFRSTDDVEEQIKNVEGDRGIPRGKGQTVEGRSWVKGHSERLLMDVGRGFTGKAKSRMAPEGYWDGGS